MKKGFKKSALTAGLALFLAAGMGIKAGPASASVISPGGTPGYLSLPELSTSSSDPGTNSGTFASTVQPVSGPSSTIYVTPTSLFGNTFISPGAGISTVTATTTAPQDLYYSPSGLDLQFINSMTNSYTLLGAGGTPTITGQVVSNVFAVGSSPAMPGAIPGELVFTYQFSVDSISPTGSNGPTQLTISSFNNPNGTGTWLLGDGVITTADGYSSPPGYTPVYTQIAGGVTPLCNGGACANGYAGVTQVNGQEGLNTALGTINYAQYQSTIPIGLDQVSPEFFVATNSYYYSLGTLSLQGDGGGSNGVSVFVPGTPEPGTLVLFGTALGLTAFMVVRKRRSQMVA